LSAQILIQAAFGIIFPIRRLCDFAGAQPSEFVGSSIQMKLIRLTPDGGSGLVPQPREVP
jgi:hypothetical protein